MIAGGSAGVEEAEGGVGGGFDGGEGGSGGWAGDGGGVVVCGGGKFVGDLIEDYYGHFVVLFLDVG